MNTRTDSAMLTNNFLLQFITDHRYRVFRHAVLLVALSTIFFNQKDPLIEPANTYIKSGILFILILVFYFNMYWLMPNLIFRERYFSYLVWIVVMISLGLILGSFVSDFIKPYLKKPFQGQGSPGILPFTIGFTVFVAASSAVKLFQRSIVVNQRMYELERLTVQSELEQLKNQINPHFLFNTLNNVNMLTKRDPEKASQVVLKLSELLRYQLYDSVRSKVFVESDIRFLEDFLNLENIRRDNFKFSINKAGTLNGVQVSPLLFITFVENAVKHNIDAEKLSFVHLDFSLSGDELNFSCINSKPDIAIKQRNIGGLGLANVQRRLNLLYPDKYQLTIHDEKNTFSVHLKLLI